MLFSTKKGLFPRTDSGCRHAGVVPPAQQRMPSVADDAPLTERGTRFPGVKSPRLSSNLVSSDGGACGARGRGRGSRMVGGSKANG